MTEDSRLVRVTDPAPLVDLDGSYYKTISAFERRFAAGAPSLKQAQSLAVNGDWTFEADVTVLGKVTLPDNGSAEVVPAGTVLGPE